MMQQYSSGHFTSDSVKFYKEFIVEITEQVVRDARVFANAASRKRIDAADIKLAVKKIFKK